MVITSNKDALLLNYLKIYINGILHLSIRRDRLDNFQSWIDEINGRCVYYIEFSYTNGTSVMAAYNDLEKFTKIIKLIDDNLD